VHKFDRAANHQFRGPAEFAHPTGCHSASDVRLAQAAGEQPVGWDVVSGDPFQPAPDPIVHAVLGRARPGSIIVMHLMGPPNAPATARALPRIIERLRTRGLRFVTLSQLLGG
jgi:peptidoglycan-N-acetylglucosamine deacetylase